MSRGRGSAGVLLAAAIMVGCALVEPAEPAGPSLSVFNGTTDEVVFLINGRQIATFPPGSTTDDIPTGAFGPQPWAVELRHVDGAPVVSMDITPGLVSAPTDESAARADLPCGTIRIWYGGPATGGPPQLVPPAVPVTGPC